MSKSPNAYGSTTESVQEVIAVKVKSKTEQTKTSLGVLKKRLITHLSLFGCGFPCAFCTYYLTGFLWNTSFLPLVFIQYVTYIRHGIKDGFSVTCNRAIFPTESCYRYKCHSRSFETARGGLFMTVVYRAMRKLQSRMKYRRKNPFKGDSSKIQFAFHITVFNCIRKTVWKLWYNIQLWTTVNWMCNWNE